MADSLEDLERKQPPVGKEPPRLGSPHAFGSSHCSQDVETPAGGAGPGPPRLHTQDPESFRVNETTASGCFVPMIVGKKYTSANKPVC